MESMRQHVRKWFYRNINCIAQDAENMRKSAPPEMIDALVKANEEIRKWVDDHPEDQKDINLEDNLATFA